MAQRDSEFETFRDLLHEDFDEAVDYESDTDFMILTTITGEDDTSRAPIPFPECGAADTLRSLPDIASRVIVNTTRSMSNNNRFFLKRKAQSTGPRSCLNWKAEDNTPIEHSR